MKKGNNLNKKHLFARLILKSFTGHNFSLLFCTIRKIYTLKSRLYVGQYFAYIIFSKSMMRKCMLGIELLLKTSKGAPINLGMNPRQR